MNWPCHLEPVQACTVLETHDTAVVITSSIDVSALFGARLRIKVPHFAGGFTYRRSAND